MAQTVIHIDELIDRIIGLLAPRELVVLSMINRRLNQVITSLALYQELSQLGTIDIFRLSNIQQCYLLNFHHLITRYGLYQGEAFDWAAEAGHTNILEWIYSTYTVFNYTTEAIDAAVANNQLNVLDWFMLHPELRFKYKFAIQFAIKNNNLIAIEWFHRQNRLKEGSITTYVKMATIEDKLDILKWFYEKFPIHYYFEQVFPTAMHYNRIQILEWAISLCLPSSYTSRDIDKVAEWGHVSVLEWLHQHRRKIRYVDAINHAIRKYHDHVLDWFAQYSVIRCTTAELVIIVIQGRINLLDRFKSHIKQAYVKNLVIRAAYCGHIHILVWFRENGFVFTYTLSVAVRAANKGHVKVFKWFRKHDYTQFKKVNADSNTMIRILKAGDKCDKLITWLQQNAG